MIDGIDAPPVEIGACDATPTLGEDLREQGFRARIRPFAGMHGDLQVAVGEGGHELRSPKFVSPGSVIEQRIQIARLPALGVEDRALEVAERGMRKWELRPSRFEQTEREGAPRDLRRVEE